MNLWLSAELHQLNVSEIAVDNVNGDDIMEKFRQYFKQCAGSKSFCSSKTLNKVGMEACEDMMSWKCRSPRKLRGSNPTLIASDLNTELRPRPRIAPRLFC